MILLNNINIIDVVSQCCIYNTNILFEKDKVVGVGVGGSLFPFAKIIDCQNFYAVPSFIDMHAHVTFDGRSHNETPNFSYCEDDNLSLLRGSQNLMEALLSGICLVRDVGAKNSKSLLLKEYVSSGKILGPELVLSGMPICSTNGHGCEFGIELDNIENLNNYFKEHKSKGYDWVKIMNDPELFEVEKLNNIVSTAHKNKLKVSIHAFTHKGITDAINSKADTIEHSLVIDDETLLKAKAQNTYFIPTFFCAWLSLRDDYTQEIPTKELEYLQQWYSLLCENFKYHIDNDVPVMCGTDAGSAPCTFSDLVDEIKMLHSNGLSSISSISAATIIPARILGKEDLFGSIEVGKLANILVLEKNPLNDIEELKRIKAIYYKGIAIKNNIQKPWN